LWQTGSRCLARSVSRYNERRKFKMSCFAPAPSALKLPMTLSASEPQNVDAEVGAKTFRSGSNSNMTLLALITQSKG
jgi:hypothetical protein